MYIEIIDMYNEKLIVTKHTRSNENLIVDLLKNIIDEYTAAGISINISFKKGTMLYAQKILMAFM